MTATDLDQSGAWQQSQNVYFGPTLGYVRVINVPTIVTSTPYTVPPFVFQPPNVNIGDVLVNLNADVTVNLPPSAGRLGYPIEVTDIGGFAFSHNITIVPNGTEKIMGLNNIAITSNYGSFVLEPIPTGGWYVP